MAGYFSGNTSHAYIVEGQKNEALKQVKRFAKALQCKNKTAGEREAFAFDNGFNCKCVSCKTFGSGNHPDVIYVSPVKNKSIGVEDIRQQVVIPAEIKPYSSDYKIYIIEDASLLTTAAQNALLKTLEEPPPYGVFLLLTENAGSFLPTILSRCVMVKITPPPLEKAFAERMLEPEFANLHTKAVDMLKQIEDAINANDLVTLLEAATKITEHKENIHTVLEIFMLFYRDTAVYKVAGQRRAVVQQSVADMIIEVAAKCRYEITTITEAIYTAMQRLKYNANLQLTIEVMLLDFWENRR